MSKLFEIGTKRIDRKDVKMITESVLNEKMVHIGKFIFGYSNWVFDIYQAPTTGVLLSLPVIPTKVFNNGKFSIEVSCTYTGMIVPTLKLTERIGNAIKNGVEDAEITFPKNSYGGLSLSTLYGKSEHPVCEIKWKKIPMFLQQNIIANKVHENWLNRKNK